MFSASCFDLLNVSICFLILMIDAALSDVSSQQSVDGHAEAGRPERFGLP